MDRYDYERVYWFSDKLDAANARSEGACWCLYCMRLRHHALLAAMYEADL